MSVKLVISNQGRDDLAGIAGYIAQDSVEQARDFVRKFVETVEDLQLWPESNPLLGDDRLRQAGLRKATVKKFRNHLLVYRYQAQTLEVLRVYHGAQDWQRQLFEGGAFE